MVLPIKISTNEASKRQFREPQTPTGHYGIFSASPLQNSILKVFGDICSANATWLTGRCSHLADSDSFDQTAGLRQTNVDTFAEMRSGRCRRCFAPAAFYYFSTNALFAFLMLTGHLYLILSFFHFHFDQLCAASGLIFVLLTATVAAFVNVNEVE